MSNIEYYDIQYAAERTISIERKCITLSDIAHR